MSPLKFKQILTLNNSGANVLMPKNTETISHLPPHWIFIKCCDQESDISLRWIKAMSAAIQVG